MIIECPNCKKQYNIASERVKQDQVKFRCQACEQIVSVAVRAADKASIDPQGSDTAPSAGAAESTAPRVESSPPASPVAKTGSSSSTAASFASGRARSRGKRLGVGGKMTLLFFLIPILLMVAAGGIYMWELKKLTDHISRDSYHIVERLSHDLVNDTARMVSEQCRLYLQSHDELVRSEFNQDAEFRRLAMQTVGETGYTCIYAVPDALGRSALLLHPNESIIGIDLPTAMKKALKENFSAWYDIYKGAFAGKATSGYYNWKEKDGSIRKKYMTCVPVKDTPFIVAATTYVEEITREVNALRTKAAGMTRNTATIIAGVFLITLAMVGTSVMVYGRRLKGNLVRLTDAAERISVGELNTEIKVDTNDEISDLSDAISRMQESIRLSIERLRRRS